MDSQAAEITLFKREIDITGMLDDLKYRLAKCRYAELYRPATRTPAHDPRSVDAKADGDINTIK